ncbi:MAG: exo-alpha-sialidase [Candidatus Binatia bacterium]
MLGVRIGTTLAVACWLVAGTVRVEAATPVFGTAAPVNGDAATDAGNDGTPRLATDGHGAWVTVWAATNAVAGAFGTDSDILAARSLDLGISWSSPAAVNTTAATDAEFDFAPALATDGHGLWVTVWVATNGPDTDIFVARSTNGGASWTAAKALHADAPSDPGNDDHPQIATDGAGTWVVVWDANGRTGNDRDVFVARSTDGGVTWSAPAAVAANATTDRGTDQRPQVTTDRIGQWLIVWASNDTLVGTKGNDFDVMVARSSDGGASWTAAVPLNGNATSDHGLDDRPQIATDGHGTWVAAWISDENLGGLLGPDLDVLTARSIDGGATWSAPAPLNSNATTDTGADGAPTLATDGDGQWVALWESNDSLGGTSSGDYDILMAHSLDGGAHWSAPHALEPAAATDTRRDIAPQLANDGNGVWNVVWAGSGGTLGADGDVLRASGREGCGNGVVDPGEQCDDGNTRGGDACPASCEFPPPPTPHATSTPGSGGGDTPSDGETPSAGSTPTTGETPTDGGQGTPATSVDPDATPTPVATGPDGSTATPNDGATATPSASVDPDATPTPVATGPDGSTATPMTGATATGGFTPAPGTTPFGGALASRTAAKAAVACQRAIVKAGAQLVGARLTKLGTCSRAVQRCIQTKPDDPLCLAKAAGRCRSVIDGFAQVDAKHSAAMRKRCGGTLALADVLGPAGLGYGWLGCGEDVVAETLDDLIACLVGEHACRGASLFEVLQPRAKELLRLPGMNAATLDTIVCLPDHGGDGDAVGDPTGQGKAVDTCATAIVKAGTSFVKKRLARMAKCADGLFSCVQLLPSDGACLAKARTKCDQGQATSTAEERKLTSAVAGRCSEGTVAYATLRAARAANLDALADACAAVGVPTLATLADYQQCVLRADSCRVEGVLAIQAPRVAELLANVGRPFGSSYCAR